MMMASLQVSTSGRKRKGQFQDNDRLSKKLSLLNLERDGQKLYVPISQSTINSPPSKPATPHNQVLDVDVMQLDDMKHKVYIHNIDDELSESDADDDGKLIFLPDIEKHLKKGRIPASVLVNGGESSDNQLVLYRVPGSLTIPEEQDSVRKAIIETRDRARAKTGQRNPEEEGMNGSRVESAFVSSAINGLLAHRSAGSNGILGAMNALETEEDDPDAMDLG